jgi:hypothetical protein
LPIDWVLPPDHSTPLFAVAAERPVPPREKPPGAPQPVVPRHAIRGFFRHFKLARGAV